MRLRAVVVVVAMLMVPLAWAAKPGEVEPVEIAIEDLLLPAKPIPAAQNSLGILRIEGLPDGTVTTSVVKAPDLYFEDGTLGAFAKTHISDFVTVTPLTITECFQNYDPGPQIYYNRCESTPNVGVGPQPRYIVLAGLFYDYTGPLPDCDIEAATFTWAEVSTSNCTITGLAIRQGFNVNECGNLVVHDPDVSNNGIFTIALTVQVTDLTQRFVVYIDLEGNLIADFAGCPEPICPGLGPGPGL